MTPTEFRTIRERAGLFQYELGALLGMDAKHINRLENGHRTITNLMAAWMRLLDVEPDLARKILEE